MTASFLLFEALAHIDAMSDAVAVGDDDRRAVIGICFEEGAERLLIAGAHGHLRDIDITVGHGDHAQVFLGRPLPLAANLATAPRGVDLEAWPPVLE